MKIDLNKTIWYQPRANEMRNILAAINNLLIQIHGNEDWKGFKVYLEAYQKNVYKKLLKYLAEE